MKPVATGHAQKFWNSEEKTKLTWRERKKLRQLQKRRENYFKVKRNYRKNKFNNNSTYFIFKSC